jgi:hypothetical protein
MRAGGGVRLTRVFGLRVLVPAGAVLVAVAITVAVLTAGNSPPGSTRNQRWRQDVAHLASELPQVHVGGLLRVPRPAWQAAASRLEAEVPRRTDGQVIVGMARMVAMLHDDETLVILPGKRFFPLGLTWVGGQLLTSVPAAQRNLLGAQILAVDGRPIAQVLSTIGSVIDDQDPALLRNEKASYLTYNPALLDWLGLTNAPDRAAFTVRAVDGVSTVIRLTAVTYVSAGALDSVPDPLYRHDQNRALLAPGPEQPARRLPEVQRLPGRRRLPAAQRGGDRRAARAPSYRLIVDLGDNGGGDTQPFTPLVGALTRDPALDRPDRIFGLIPRWTRTA